MRKISSTQYQFFRSRRVDDISDDAYKRCSSNPKADKKQHIIVFVVLGRGSVRAVDKQSGMAAFRVVPD